MRSLIIKQSIFNVNHTRDEIFLFNYLYENFSSSTIKEYVDTKALHIRHRANSSSKERQ